MRINCKDCACWWPDPETNGKQGACRYSPPTVVDCARAAWPATEAEMWCADGYAATEDNEGEDLYARAWKEGRDEARRGAMAVSAGVLYILRQALASYSTETHKDVLALSPVYKDIQAAIELLEAQQCASSE